MGRKPKVTKEVKIQACLDYMNGVGSCESIGGVIGVHKETVRSWYKKYLEHGSNAFNTDNKNQSYSKSFKLKIIELYNEGALSGKDLASKYNLSNSVVYDWINKYNDGIEIKEYDPKSEVYTMNSKKTTLEEKLEIVKYVLTNNYDYKGAASKYGVRYSSIYSWTKKYLTDGEYALQSKKRGPKKDKEIKLDELTEVERLKYLLSEEKKKREIAEFKVEALKKNKKSKKYFIESKTRINL